MKKRFLSLLLCMVLALGLLPTAAFAAEDDPAVKAIQLGTSGISDPTATTTDEGAYQTPSDYIYFGINSGNSSTPIKWRVLDADTANDGTTSGMFLLSEYLLAPGVYFNSDSSKGSVYQGSDAQTWCRNFVGSTSNFSTAEQGAMLGVTKTDSAESNLYSMSWGESSLTADGDKLFSLSVRELADYVGNYNTAPGLLATDTAQSAGGWWLRSPDANSTHYAGVVDYYGSVGSLDEENAWAVRPAFNLNLNSVLFKSAAKGSKSASGMESGLTAVTDYAGSEWKLTLKDSSRNFTITEDTVTGTSGGIVALNYTGATVGTKEYISVILVDSNNSITHYGRVLQPSAASGTVSIKIPEGLAQGNYTLKVFSEQCNGDYKTDYASAFEDVTLTVTKKTPTLTLSANSGTVYSDAGTTSFTYTYDGDGTVSATSSDDSVAEVSSIIGDTITLNVLKAGTATITVSAEAGANYTAAAAQTYELTVTRKTPTLTLSANSGTVYSNAGTTSFTYTYNGDGTVSAISSDDSVAKVSSITGDTITLNVLKAGSATITVSAGEGSNYTAADNQTYELTVKQYVAPSYNDSDPTYAVTVNKAEHGTVTASRRYAERGERVTLTVKPDKGWTLETLSVTDRNGKKIDLAIVKVGEKYTFQMPSGKVTVEATFMEDNTMLNYFVDVSASDYYYDAVLWAAVNGITSGVDALHFAPSAPCTRGQIVTFLWRAAGSPEPQTMSGFADVPADSYCAKAVAWAVERGITSGTGNGRFSPDEACTRAQAVTFLYRAAGSPAVSGYAEFDDVMTDAYYAGAVAWATEQGVTEGVGSHRFAPDDTCTRGQIVTFLWRSQAD